MRTVAQLTSLLCLLTGCAARFAASDYTSEVPGLPAERVLAATEQPALFLGAEHDAPAIGYASDELIVRLLGESEAGRVKVRVLGALEVDAHVPAELLTMRVQRRGRLRDTPVYVGPNDRVVVLGPDAEAGRVRVSASPALPGQPALRFEGSYPARGLDAHRASTDTLAPESGAPYTLAAGLPLELLDAPDGRPVATLPGLPLAREVAVLRIEGPWFAVRVGTGPYLIGYTRARLTPHAPQALPAQAVASDRARASGVPERLAHEQGPLKRVVVGTRIAFNDQPIAVLHAEAWARVLSEYPNGEVDAFVAVDDSVAVRGLVPLSALRDPPAAAARAEDAALSETASKAAAP